MTAGAGRRSTRSRSRSTDRRRDRSRSRERRHDRSRDRRRSLERSQRDERARESRPERRDRSRSRSRSPRRDERRAGESYRGRSGSPHGRREGGGYRSERARAEEWAPQDSSREQEQQAMPAPARRGPGPCFKCGEEGHMARECPNAPAGGSSHGPCYKCGEAGHIARDCPNPEAAGAGPGSRRRRQDDGDEGGNMAWGKPGEQEEEAPPDKEVEPEFGLSGALAAETNRVNGVVLLHQEPPEARKPTARWRLYVFKNGQPFGDPLHIHRMSSYLFGRERRVADVPTDHPSCSKQHAVLQFRCGAAVGQRTLSRNATTAVLLLTNGGHQRNLPALPLCRLTEKEGADGMMHGSVRPYLMDLGSTNGTFLNGERLEPERYYELLEKDLVRFGNSTREYVLLKEK